MTLYQPTVLEKWHILKRETFCIKRFIGRHGCHEQVILKRACKIDTKATLNVELVQEKLLQTHSEASMHTEDLNSVVLDTIRESRNPTLVKK